MIEVFKSKIMLLFMMVVFGVIFFDCSLNNNLENEEPRESMIALNS